MSSFIRRMERRREKQSADYKPAPNQVRDRADGGFDRLHPTKGWKRTSGRRLEAQRKIAALQEEIDRRMGRDVMSRLRALASRDAARILSTNA